jgi:hypothetical protein
MRARTILVKQSVGVTVVDVADMRVRVLERVVPMSV